MNATPIAYEILPVDTATGSGLRPLGLGLRDLGLPTGLWLRDSECMIP